MSAALALSLSVPAGAQVIYNNGGPNPSSGSDATQWVQAEDFSFATNATVTGAGVYIAGLGNLGTWDGNFTYYLFDSSGGAPGGLLASGDVSTVVTNTGNAWCCGGNSYLVEFDFLSTFAAAAGSTYWLGIHLSDNFDRDDVYWVTTSGNGTSRAQESINGTFDNWSSNNLEHAFYLTGDRIVAPVPEPGTWAMMLLGFGAIGAAFRRRRRPHAAFS